MLTLPAALQLVEAEAFASNTAMDMGIPPDGMTAIGERAFVGCQYLYQVELPATVISIAGNAFEGCGPVIIRCDAGSYAGQYAHSLTVNLRQAASILPAGSRHVRPHGFITKRSVPVS